MNYLSFKEFVDEYGLKDEASSSVKIKEILDENNFPAGIYMRNDAFTTNIGIVNLNSFKGTHWLMFVDDIYFGSYCCPPPMNKRNQIDRGFYSEYQIQKNDSYCAF